MVTSTNWPEVLLGRELFELPAELCESFREKRILVTGGAGSIGSALVKRLVELKPEAIVVFDSAEDHLYRLHREFADEPSGCVELVLGNVNFPEELHSTVQKHRPHVVFHAAAYKHVDFLETQILAAVRTNIFGTRNVLALRAEERIEKIVALSSDKATNPASVLGVTKRVGELLVLEQARSGADVCSVRLCNVLGTAGSLLPLVLEQIEQRHVAVTDNAAERYFIGAREAADLLLSAASSNEHGILVPANVSRLNIRELVERMLEKTGIDGVAIEVTGLRPGEKISEELYSREEEAQPSTARGFCSITQQLQRRVDLSGLERSYAEQDENGIMEELISLVPEYCPERQNIPVSQ